MSNKGKGLFGIGLTITASAVAAFLIIIMLFPYLYHPGGSQVTTINGVTTINNGGGNPPFAGSVSFLVSPLWAYTPSTAANEGTNDPTYSFYHADKTLIGTETITSHVPVATTLTVSAADNGIVYMAVFNSASAQTYVTDPSLTASNNPNWITGWQANTDLDTNGQYELLFKMSLASIQYNVGQTPQVQLNVYKWKVDTATVTSLSNPTFSVAAGGDLDITGYLLFAGGAGYVLPVAQINVWISGSAAANTTASSLSTKITASAFYLTSVKVQGTGAQTGRTYGQTFAPGTYDPSNTRYVVFQATDSHDGGTIVDVHQPNWAMPFVYERNSGATWLQWDMKFHASAAGLTASKVYYVYIEFLVLTSTGSSASEGLSTTITTTA